LIALTGDILDGLGQGGITLWGVNLTGGDVDLGANPANQNADRSGPRTEGSYHKLGANLARLQRLTSTATLWASVNAQWAGKNLDSSEKLALGGPSGVRAYPVMEGTGDEGWLATLEGRYNLSAELQITAFLDNGYIRRDHDASYTGALLPATAILRGAGLGVNWSQPGKYTLRATVAQRIGNNPLRALATGKDQDGSLTRTRLWLTAIAYF
jgi:hemolysin activation/secretion protein